MTDFSDVCGGAPSVLTENSETMIAKNILIDDYRFNQAATRDEI